MPGPPPGGYSVTTYGLPPVLIWRARDMRLFRVVHGPARTAGPRARTSTVARLRRPAAVGFRKLRGAFRLAAEPAEHQGPVLPVRPAGTGLAASHASTPPPCRRTCLAPAADRRPPWRSTVR